MAPSSNSTYRIDCRRCKHYYVTWDKRFPHGCRSMKFKAKTLPAAAVVNSSRMHCLYYVERKRSGDKGSQAH